MRVLIGCEFTGIARRAFAAHGHDAWSCDLLPAEDRSNRHIVGDIRPILVVNYKPPVQTVQPWWFGDQAFKATGFYLKGLPALVATNRLVPPMKETDEYKAWSAIHRMQPGPDRAKNRSRPFPVMIDAFAEQWGGGDALGFSTHAAKGMR